MLTQEDMKALQTMMETVIDKKLEPINERLDHMDERLDRVGERLDRIEEDLAEVRGATNYIAEWVERVENKVNNKAM